MSTTTLDRAGHAGKASWNKRNVLVVLLCVRREKWNEWGFRPSVCTCRLNWARKTYWGWWDEWDDTTLQTQNSKFDPWRSEAEHATSRSRRLPTLLNLYEWAGEKIRFFKTWRPKWGSNPRSPTFQAGLVALTTALGPLPALVHDARLLHVKPDDQKFKRPKIIHLRYRT